MNYIECTPAYGREYTSQAAVKKDWAAGKDFKIASYGPDMGRYINKGDAQENEKYMIRYANLQKIVIV